jgi:hypothetical protein
MADPWLSGWKAIAAHIGLTVKTAKKLHKEHGLPVRALPTGGLRVALPHELKEWLIRYNTNLEKVRSMANDN